jgi:hypothetical protein
MNEWLIKFIASRLDGKKAYLGATGQMLTGLGTIITGIVGGIGTLYPDTNLPALELELAWATIMGGAYMISSGFKSWGQRAATAKIEEKI